MCDTVIGVRPPVQSARRQVFFPQITQPFEKGGMSESGTTLNYLVQNDYVRASSMLSSFDPARDHLMGESGCPTK